MNSLSAISGSVSNPLSKLSLNTKSLEAAPQPQGVSFQSLMTDAISQVGNLQSVAQAGVEQSLMGGDITQAEVFSAMKKADMALKTMIQIRNKMVEAFNEIQQIRV